MEDRPINAEKIIFGVEFNVYFDYIEITEKFLDAEQKKEEVIIQAYLRKWGQADDDMSYLRAMGIFPGKIVEIAGLLRDSFFVSLYSFFENTLIRECRLRKTDLMLLDFEDIRGFDVIDRVKKYFTKVLRAPFPTTVPEWEAIQNYRIIRNCIVHAQGRLDELKDKKDRDKLQRFVNKNQNISLTRSEEDVISFVRSDGQIYLHKGFCEDAIKIIHAFLEKLLFPD